MPNLNHEGHAFSGFEDGGEASAAREAYRIALTEPVTPEAYELFAPLLRSNPGSPYEAIIDCGEVRRLSSAGMGLFLMAQSHAARCGGEVRLVNCGPELARVLESVSSLTSSFKLPFERKD